MNPQALLAVAIATASFTTHAQTLMVAGSEGGNRVFLHAEVGICVGEARRARWVGISGAAVEGCWKINGATVSISFLDADGMAVPVTEFRKSDGV